MDEERAPATVAGRLRSASTSMAGAVMNFNPQPGMWAATGTAIAYAPTLSELREPLAGGRNIEFTEHGHSARTIAADDTGTLTLAATITKTPQARARAQTVTTVTGTEPLTSVGRRPTIVEQLQSEEKHTWIETTIHGLSAAWKFISTPTGFLMTLYGLNIVAWGAMLFFLELGAAPAMNHPSKDAINSPRKIWLEIDSQILNALFCVTGFGLAPWRFRDLYWLIQARHFRNKHAMKRLCKQNQPWFRPPAWYHPDDEESGEEEKRLTFTGEVAPPTKIWKLSFVVWMMVMNTLLQGVLSGFMWGYNRINRPSWATGTFIGLGCAVSLLAGLMMWWEGRKVKKIEGPVIKLAEPGAEPNPEQVELKSKSDTGQEKREPTQQV
jgi:hypothetical protein